jgi:hypothetical protein
MINEQVGSIFLQTKKGMNHMDSPLHFSGGAEGS